MSNSHEKKSVTNMLIGLACTSIGIMTIVYASFSQKNQHDWLFWAIIPIITINTGLLFISSAVIHKVKADLIRRQKQKNSKSDKLEE
jgi:heme/copper-type cytochrome/quinol oxidase subunit 3